MTDFRKTMDLFVLELPDPEVALFEQITRQFTCFSKLPIEIRLEIWKAAFPSSRYVDLAGPCLYRIGKQVFDSKDSLVRHWRGIIRNKRNDLKAQFPATLSVNQESRAETRKHYAITFPKRDLPIDLCGHVNDNCDAVPLWLNPYVDSAFITNWMKDERFSKGVDYIAETAPKVLGRIRKLEIRIGFDQDSGTFLSDFDIFLKFPSLRIIGFQAGWTFDMFTQREIDSFMVTFGIWFRGLEKLGKKSGISHSYFQKEFLDRDPYLFLVNA